MTKKTHTRNRFDGNYTLQTKNPNFDGYLQKIERERNLHKFREKGLNIRQVEHEMKKRRIATPIIILIVKEE